MQYVYTALLLHSTGKEITEANVKKAMDAVGAKADDARVKALVASLEGVNIDEAIAKAAVTAAPAAAPVAAKHEEKAEDKAKTEEEAAAGLGALFG